MIGTNMKTQIRDNTIRNSNIECCIQFPNGTTRSDVRKYFQTGIFHAFTMKYGNLVSEDECKLSYSEETDMLTIAISDSNHSKDFDMIEIYDMDQNVLLFKLRYLEDQYIKGYGTMEVRIKLTDLL